MPECPIPSEAVAALAALLGAALGAFLSHRYSRNRDRLEMKRDVLRRLMGYRWQLTPGRAHPDGAVFTALNEIPVVFAGEEDVERAIADFRGELGGGFRAEHFVPLAQAMAKAAGVPHKRWSPDLIGNPFTPAPNDLQESIARQ